MKINLQCLLSRLLENDLQRLAQRADIRERELKQQVEELRKDNEKCQKLIGQVRMHIFYLTLANNRSKITTGNLYY